MENNTQFKITYYSNKDKKHITRNEKIAIAKQLLQEQQNSLN